jgi:hypothetical protein
VVPIVLVLVLVPVVVVVVVAYSFASYYHMKILTLHVEINNALNNKLFLCLEKLLIINLCSQVDSLERQRNDEICLNWQQNRNPFIDHPEWVQQINDF